MGTSGSYGGPGGAPPLLPPWLPGLDAPIPPDQEPKPDENPDTDTEQKPTPEQKPGEYIQTSTWTSAKGSMTRYVNSGNGESLRGTGRRYVGTRGGSSGIARSAVAGKRTATTFGSFLSDIATQGINSALGKRGLQDLIGESADTIIAEIADKLAPPGETNEEAVARQAIIDAMAYLYDEYDLEEGDLTKLDSIGEDDVEKVFESYVVSYIFERWLHELGKRIEDNAITESRAIKLEKQTKDFVKEAVKIDFDDYDLLTIDWAKSDGIIDNIFTQAYSFLEVEE